MVTSIVLAGILFPIAIYLGIAAIFLLVLGCASYVCIFAVRQDVNKSYRKLKLRYWQEQSFDFLGLPPEIRLMVYRYTLPLDHIYHMTGRKHRFYGSPPHEGLKDEIIPQPLCLLRVCRLVYEELWPLIYKQCIFYITIYSIRDLLYVMDLLDAYATSRNTLRGRDIFYHMSEIHVRVNNFTIRRHAEHRSLSGARLLNLSLESKLWSGPGATSLLKTETQVLQTISFFARRDILSDIIAALVLKDFIQRHMLRPPILDTSELEKMLPWYHRYQRQRFHELHTSPA